MQQKTCFCRQLWYWNETKYKYVHTNTYCINTFVNEYVYCKNTMYSLMCKWNNVHVILKSECYTERWKNLYQ